MARDEELSLAMLQGAGSSFVGLYQPSVLVLWLPLWGRTMAHYSGMNAVLDSSQKDLRTMKSISLAVFGASTQCTDEVKEVTT